MTDYYKYPPACGDYTYIQGFGYMPITPSDKERSLICSTFSAISIGLLVYMLLELSIPIVFNDILSSASIISSWASFLQASELAQIMTLLTVSISSIACFGVIKSMIKIPFLVAVPHRVPSLSYCLCAAAIFQGIILTLGTYSSQFFESILAFAHIYKSHNQLVIPSSQMSAIILVLNLSLFTPVLEELVFRGIIMQSLRRYGDGFAIFISAVAFAMLHRSPFLFPYAFLSGLLFGFFVVKSQSLLISIILHSINNTIFVIFELLSVSIQSAHYQIIYNAYLMFSLVMSLFACSYLLKTRTNAFFISTQPTNLSFGKKLKTVFLSVPAIVVIIVIFVVSKRSITF